MIVCAEVGLLQLQLDLSWASELNILLPLDCVMVDLPWICMASTRTLGLHALF